MHTPAHSTTRSPTQRAFLRFLKNKAAVASLIFICFLVLAVIIGPWIIPHDPNEMDLIKGASPPDFTHWMGTDIQGRDLLSRCLTGGRVSLQVGLLGTLVASVIGITALMSRRSVFALCRRTNALAHSNLSNCFRWRTGRPSGG